MEAVFVSHDGVKPYDAASRRASIHKFLIMKGLLVIAGTGRGGDGVAHKYLADEYTRHTGVSISSADLIGAGDMESGRVTGWRSVGFGITTPEELRPEVERALCPIVELPAVVPSLCSEETAEKLGKRRVFEDLKEIEKYHRTPYGELTEEDRERIKTILKTASRHAITTTTWFDVVVPAAHSFFEWAKRRFGLWRNSFYTDHFHDWRTLRAIAVIHCELLIESSGGERETRFRKRLAGEWMEEMGYWADALRYYSEARGYYAWSGEFIEDRDTKKRLERLRDILEECRHPTKS